jgi:hypothetical protein
MRRSDPQQTPATPAPPEEQKAVIPTPNPRHRAIRRANVARAIREGNSSALKHGVYAEVACC